MTMQPINPPLPVITPKGKARAFWIIDYHFEDYLYFVCFIDETGECWTYDNREVKLQANITAGRTFDNSGAVSSERKGSRAGNAARTGKKPSGSTPEEAAAGRARVRPISE